MTPAEAQKLSELCDKLSHEQLSRITRAAIGRWAGHCIRVHYDTPEEQRVFDTLVNEFYTPKENR